MADSELQILIQARDEMSRVIDALTKKLTNLEKSLNRLGGDEMEDLGDDTKKASVAAEKLSEDIKDVHTNAQKLSKSGAKKLGKDLDSAEKKARKLNATMVKVAAAGRRLVIAGTAIAAVFGSAAKGSAEFQKGVAEVATLTDEGGKAIDRLSKTVLNLSDTYGQAKEEVTGGLYDAISAGVPDGVEAVKFMDVALKTSVGGVTDVKTAVSGLTTVLNAWKLESSDVTRVSDILFTTVKNGKTTMEELSRYMFQAAPLAASLGVRFEEIAAATATMTKQGTPTSIAMTQIRAAMQGIIRPTNELSAVFQDATGKSAEWVVQNQGLKAAFDILIDATKGSKGELLKLVGSVEGMNAILSITGKNAKTFASDMKSVEESAGAAQKAFDVIDAEEARDFTKAMNKVSNAWTRFGTAVLPIVAQWFTVASEWIDSMTTWIVANEELVNTLATLLGTIAAVSVSLGALLLIFSPLVRAMLALHTHGGKIATVLLSILVPGKKFRAWMVTTTISATSLGGALRLLALAAQRMLLVWGPIGALVYAVYKIWEFVDATNAAIENSKKLGVAYRNNTNALKEMNKYAGKKVEEFSDEELSKYKATLNEVITTYAELAVVAKDIGREDVTKKTAENLVFFKSRLKELNTEVARRATLSAQAAEAEKKAQNQVAISLKRTEVNATRTVEELSRLNDLDFASGVEQLDRLTEATRQALVGSGDTAGLSALEQQYTDTLLGLAEKRMQQQITIEQRRAVETKRILDASTKTEKEKAEETIEITRTLVDARLAAMQQYYDILNREIDGALANQRKYAAEVIALEQSIKDEKERQGSTIEDLVNQGLTAYELYTKRKKELSKLSSDYTRAYLRGDYEEAERIARKQEELSKKLNQEVEGSDGSVIVSKEKARLDTIKRLEEVYGRINQSQEAQKRVAENTAETEGVRADNIKEQLARLKDQIAQVSDQKIDIEVNMSLEAAESKLKELRAEFDDFGGSKAVIFEAQDNGVGKLFEEIENFTAKTYPIKLVYQVTGNLPQGNSSGFAVGGPVFGPGTSISDSIMAWLSNGEFVMRAAAVKHYGMDFFKMLNSMSMPKSRSPGFANGGPVVSSSSSGGSSGTVNRDIVDLNLSLGGSTVELMGERDQVRALVTTLKGMRR